MARPTTSTFGQFAIKIGDGATPTELFTLLCGLTSKGFDINNNVSSTAVPDCADEDAPAFEEMFTKSQSISLKGSGIFTQEGQKTILAIALAGKAINVRVYPGGGPSASVDYYAGPAILKTIGLAAAQGDKMTQTLDWVFAKQPTVVLKA